jgi:molecular chaperone GrpE
MRHRRDREEEPTRVDVGQPQSDEENEPQPQAPPTNAEELQAENERLKSELEEQQKKTAEEHDQYLRALADFNNFRRRHQDEYKQAVQFAAQELILKLLPVLDNFERALQSAEQTQNFEGLIGGVKLTLRQLRDILEREGVKPIKALGEQFDPMMHEAVMRVESDEYPENTVVEELQPGYTHHGRVIRPSAVKVAMSPD